MNRIEREAAMTAADLIVMLEHARDTDVPLHKIPIFVMCDDDYYSGYVSEASVGIDGGSMTMTIETNR
jgi:hypothetical protein